MLPRPWQKSIVICMPLLQNDLRYIDKYMLLNVDCNLQNDSRRRNISLFDNRARILASSFANFFNNVNIYCLDINLANFKYYSKKFKVFGLDVSNKVMINKFLKENNIKNDQTFFDIIIDDCSHRLSDQINSFFY